MTQERQSSSGQSHWVLVLGTADWNQPIATNQHYAVKELAGAARVTYIESLGLRRPKLSRRDLARVWRRLRHRSGHERVEFRAVPRGVEIVSPILIPRHVGIAARVNRRLLARIARRWSTSDHERVLLTYTPTTYGLDLDASTALYHCVDLLGEFPGIDSAMIERNEKAIARRGMAAAASSPAVSRHLREMGFATVLEWPNVVDLTMFDEVDLSVAREDAAVFAGNLTSTKVDFELLVQLVRQGVTLHLAGPIAEGGGAGQQAVDALVAEGATYHGNLTLDALARLYARCKVGVIPYWINAYTSGVNPLKVYEYLAAGLLTVSTGVEAVIPRAGDVVKVDSRSEFVEAVARGLTSAFNPADVDRRMAVAHAHSWSVRGDELRRALLRRVG